MMYSVMKRRREGVTNYHKRLKLLMSGLPRLVVRPSNKGMTVQLVNYSEGGDVVIATVTEKSLKKLGLEVDGNSVPVSYLVGYALGLKCKKKKVKNAILDSGRYNIIKGGRISAVLKGVVDGGVKVPHEASVFPKKDRLNGKHLKNGAAIKIDEMKKLLEEKI